MYLKFQNSHGRTYIYLKERKKTEEGTYKEINLKSLGAFPASFTPFQIKEMEDLMRDIVKVSNRTNTKENILRKIDNEDLVDIINSQPDLADLMPVNLTPIIVDKILTCAGYKKLFKKLQKTTKCSYDLYNVFRYIITHNTVDPGSLLYYFQTQNQYFFPDSDQKIKEQNLYRFLTFFNKHYEEIQKAFLKLKLEQSGSQNDDALYSDDLNCTSNIDEDSMKPVEENFSPVFVYNPGHIASHNELGRISEQVLTQMKDIIEQKTSKKIRNKKLQKELKEVLFSRPITRGIYMMPDFSEPVKALLEAFDIKFWNRFVSKKEIDRLFNTK